MSLPICLACDAHVSHVNALSSFCDDCNKNLEESMAEWEPTVTDNCKFCNKQEVMGQFSRLCNGCTDAVCR